MDIQAGIYATFQKVLDENGKEVWRRTGGGSSADLSAYPTREEMKAYAPQKLMDNIIVHLDANHANASDTLDEGRGLSAEKPFRTFDATWDFIAQNYVGGRDSATIELHSDIVSGRKWRASKNVDIIIKSDATRRKLTLGNVLTFANGNVSFDNLDVDMANFYLAINGWNIQSGLGLKNVKFTGTAMSIVLYGGGAGIFASGDLVFEGTANSGGLIQMFNGLAQIEQARISGTATGKRYCLTSGAVLLAGGKADQLPGTVAGTCDESSIVV